MRLPHLGLTQAPGGIPRYRKTRAPALFSEGYRPFFLAALLWAAFSIPVWLGILSGRIGVPPGFDAVAWHGHEMIYGFAVAAMAGFLLTAIPNWTGRFPLQGPPLMLLFLLWCAGRLAMAASASIGAPATAAIDMSFLPVFLATAAREVLAGRNWRNLPALAALVLLLIGDGLAHLERAGLLSTDGLGIRLGMATFAGLIALIGGRLIPSFTRNRLAKMGSTRSPAFAGPLDSIGMVVAIVALAGWVAGADDAIAAPLLLAAGIAGAMRLARWRGWSIRHDALILAMHLGYAWLCAGLALLGLSRISPAVPQIAALHALGSGAIATMIAAVMTRATLAYAGGPQQAGLAIGSALGLLQVAALLRVTAAFLPSAGIPLLGASGAAWAIGFAGLSLVVGQRLIEPRKRNR